MRRGMLIAVILATSTGAIASAAEPQSVTAGGTTLTSLTVTWPSSDRPLPPGPGVNVVNSNCTSCHSTNMILTQPTLSQSDWQGEVAKMRKVFKASIDDAAVPTIVEYLTALQSNSNGH